MFSTGEIMFALFILLAVFVGFTVALVAGIKGFHRLGLGQRDSIVAKVAPVIGVLDLLLFLSTFREVLLFAIAPFAAHVIAFVVGVNKRQGDPPPQAEGL